MIGTLFRLYWTNLFRDRAVQVMVFVLPIAFFSIFAVIFGGGGSNFSTSRLGTVVVDESGTDISRALVSALQADPGLRARTTWAPKGAAKDAAAVPVNRARAEQLVRDGDVPVAIVLPAGIDTSLARFDGRDGVKVVLLTDPADRVAAPMAAGLLQRATMAALSSAAGEFRGAGGGPGFPRDFQVAPTVAVPVVGTRQDNGMVAFYAAGIAVMFLMFSAAGAGGTLIEETETGTLERLLSSGGRMGTLLAAKWLYVASLGVVQISVMFVWGMLVFKLPLLTHLAGFAIMTAATAACAAAFGLVLATLARTRQQLQGLANIIVLSLSAIGGSMFPRFLMSESLQKFSLIGFNAWALDGYLKVFWRESPSAALAPQVGALAGFTLLFLLIARRLAKRWEAV